MWHDTTTIHYLPLHLINSTALAVAYLPGITWTSFMILLSSSRSLESVDNASTAVSTLKIRKRLLLCTILLCLLSMLQSEIQNGHPRVNTCKLYKANEMSQWYYKLLQMDSLTAESMSTAQTLPKSKASWTPILVTKQSSLPTFANISCE